MTKKRYPKSPRVSRSAPTRRRLGYPFERRYDAIKGNDEHPIDVIIDRIPRVRVLDRTLVRLSRRVQQQVRDGKGFINYEDTRAEQRTLREQAFFDAGHQAGRLDGVVESLNSSVKLSREARAFARQIHIARLASKLSVDRAIAVMLEFARGLVVGERLQSRGRR